MAQAVMSDDYARFGLDPDAVGEWEDGARTDDRAKTGKPVGAVVRYTYVDGDDSYVVTFDRKRDLVRNPLATDLSWVKRAAARLVRFDGAYLRFAGVLTIAHYRGGRLVEQVAADAIWELMYFGHARDGGPASERVLVGHGASQQAFDDPDRHSHR